MIAPSEENPGALYEVLSAKCLRGGGVSIPNLALGIRDHRSLYRLHNRYGYLWAVC